MYAIDFTVFNINTLLGPMFIPTLPQSVLTLVPITARIPLMDYTFVQLILCDNLTPKKAGTCAGKI